ncbi:MAG: signal peptide peptidase SppA [Desulfobulbaceae bacterium]
MVLTNLVFLAFLVLLLSLLGRPPVEVPEKAALIVAPAGELVDKKTVIDPVSRFFNNVAGIPMAEETLVQDIIDVIRAGAEDERIQLLVLDLDNLEYGSLNQLRDIGQSLDAFRESGKKIIALGDAFDQANYYLASFADEIYLHPMGSVTLQGFGVYRLYLKELMDRLAVNFHVFRVGSYKSALEPFTRTDMSPEARSANREWLDKVWNLFCADIAQNRGFSPDFIDTIIAELPARMAQAQGDSARMALESNLVDGIMTRGEAEEYLIGLTGRSEDGTTFRQVHFLDYLDTITPSFTEAGNEQDQIAIIVARGNIVYGEMVPGQISSEGLSDLLRQAREDEKIRAVVLRLDSGGGSAFASEVIRGELLLLREEGKPVVISMGSLAASGGYWIASAADRILASPFTLTGSIGIYGMIPTFENTLAKAGISNDGVGTTPLAGAGDPARPLPPQLAETIQLGVEEGYRRFLSIVAEGRGMEVNDVKKIAQGKVWDGARAVDIGLVDNLGDLEDGIVQAAELAGLDSYAPLYLQHTIPTVIDFFSLRDWWSENNRARIFALFSGRSAGFLRSINDAAAHLVLRSDPGNLYAHSLLPPRTPAF